MSLFGDLIVEEFQLKIDCISLKKEISYILVQKNKGEKISKEALEEYLENVLASYKEELDGLLLAQKASKSKSALGLFESQEIKKIYHRIAKLLHPDMSPITKEHPELLELFNRVVYAYKLNEYKMMKELEVIVNKELKDRGIDSISVVIPDLKDRINELKDEIKTLIEIEPYILKKYLDDEELQNNKFEELKKSISELKEYRTTLQTKRNELME